MRGSGVLIRWAAWPAAAAVVLASLSACGGESDAAAGNRLRRERATTTAVVTTTTVALTPEQEVEAAYLRSWDVYARAVRTFDESELATVYAERALETISQEVRALRAAHMPVRCSVDHDYKINFPSTAQAFVRDRYVNHCVLLDAEGRSTEPDPNGLRDVTYTLKKVDGDWKVIFRLEDY